MKVYCLGNLLIYKHEINHIFDKKGILVYSSDIIMREFDNDNFKLDLDVKDTRIEDFEIERFSEEYEINPSSGTVRPYGGDYFKKITFNLSNGKKLCICAEDSETDGYCDIWTEYMS